MHFVSKTHTSKYLNREMTYHIYGNGGKIFLAFPSQSGHVQDFANNGMIDCIQQYIDNQQITIVCVDGNDQYSFDGIGSEHERINHHADYMLYVTKELIPVVKTYYKKVSGNKYDGKLGTTGCSMGAYHALNFALNFPDKFDTVIGLSGIYHAAFFFPHYSDPQIYFNSPTDLLTHLDTNHPILDSYRQLNIMLCAGQGAWEQESIEDLQIIDNECKRLAIPCWADLWGFDVDHHWYWWQKQLPYFMEHYLNNGQ